MSLRCSLPVSYSPREHFLFRIQNRHRCKRRFFGRPNSSRTGTLETILLILFWKRDARHRRCSRIRPKNYCRIEEDKAIYQRSSQQSVLISEHISPKFRADQRNRAFKFSRLRRVVPISEQDGHRCDFCPQKHIISHVLQQRRATYRPDGCFRLIP